MFCSSTGCKIGSRRVSSPWLASVRTSSSASASGPSCPCSQVSAAATSVEIDGALGQAGALGHVGHRHRGVRRRGEGRRRGAQDLRAALQLVGVGAGALLRRGSHLASRF
jgi:hypothetical protein